MKTLTKWVFGLNIATITFALAAFIVTCIKGVNISWSSLGIAIFSTCSFIINFWKYRKG